MDFMARLRDWLARHPLKEPTHANRAAYTAEVMARVKARVSAPHAPGVRVQNRLAWGWPRLAAGLAAAAASVLLALTVHGAWRGQRLARAAAEEAEVLVALDEEALPLREEDLLLLAEMPAETDEQWLDETLQLLEELDEALPDDATSGGSEEEWLKELERLEIADG